MFRACQTFFTQLHLKNKWLPSSSSLLQTTHFVSKSIPLLHSSIRTAKLLWAIHHRKCFTFPGHSSFHRAFQCSASILLPPQDDAPPLLLNRWSQSLLLTQKLTHWNPRASVRQTPESQPSVPVNLTCNWQGIKQSQIQERIGWDSEYLSHRRIGRLCWYRRQQKDSKCERIMNERVGWTSWCTKRQN